MIRRPVLVLGIFILAGCAGPRGGASLPGRSVVSSGPCDVAFRADVWKAAYVTEEGGPVQFSGPGPNDIALLKCQEADMPLTVLRDQMISNMKAEDDDAKIVASETRRVNGTNVFYLKGETVTVQTIRTYWFYLYASRGKVARFMVSHAGPNSRAHDLLSEMAESRIGEPLPPQESQANPFDPVAMDLLNGLTISR